MPFPSDWWCPSCKRHNLNSRSCKYCGHPHREKQKKKKESEFCPRRIAAFIVVVIAAVGILLLLIFQPDTNGNSDPTQQLSSLCTEGLVDGLIDLFGTNHIEESLNYYGIEGTIEDPTWTGEFEILNDTNYKMTANTGLNTSELYFLIEKNEQNDYELIQICENSTATGIGYCMDIESLQALIALIELMNTTMPNVGDLFGTGGGSPSSPTHLQ